MVSQRMPWTRAEIEALIPKIERRIQEAETEWPAARPLPPMTVEESLDYHNRLMDLAASRPLTESECFLAGQIMAVFKQAVQAEMLGKKGRYVCFSEEMMKEML